MRNRTLIDIAEVALETFYHYCRRRFLTRRVASIASCRFGVGSHSEWRPHSTLGECHRLLGCGYACIHA
jgi:hypothetical protein